MKTGDRWLMGNWASGKFTKWKPRWTGSFLSAFQQSGHVQMTADEIGIIPADQANTKAGTTWDVSAVVPVLLTELRTLISSTQSDKQAIWNSWIWSNHYLTERTFKNLRRKFGEHQGATVRWDFSMGRGSKSQHSSRRYTLQVSSPGLQVGLPKAREIISLFWRQNPYYCET